MSCSLLQPTTADRVGLEYCVSYLTIALIIVSCLVAMASSVALAMVQMAKAYDASMGIDTDHLEDAP